MNRSQRAALAQETVQILKSGEYRTAQGTLSIADRIAAACRATRLYRPGDYDQLLEAVAALPEEDPLTVAVSNRTTLAAARSLSAVYPSLACLNFASAKNPGGGFLSGSEAQEESLARASALYATLQTQQEFYELHRRGGSSLYSDHVILSPGVVVFRDDSGALLDTPWSCTFLTAAAANAGAVRANEPHNETRIRPTLRRRAEMVLAIAALERSEALVLGAWGCGVFRNDPTEVAEIFAALLDEPRFRRRFRHVELAVLDRSAEGGTIKAFERVFGAAA